MNLTFLILGGYGAAGLPIAEGLLRETQAKAIIAGRNADKARACAASLAARYGQGRAEGIALDARDGRALVKALNGATMVVVASSTSDAVRTVAEAALEAGADYFDIQYAAPKVEVLKTFAERIASAGRCFITDGGFHPGLPAALVRYAATRMDEVHVARVSSLIRIDWKGITPSESTATEFARELSHFESKYYRDRTWRRASMTSTKDFLSVDFGEPFSVQRCVPMFFEELRPLPDALPTLRDTGFFIAGFDPITDYLVMPLCLAMLKCFPKTSERMAGKLLFWSLRKFSKPPYGTLLKLEASGARGGLEARLETTLRHDDGYLFTAIPVVACLLQYADGSIRKPGLWTMGNIAEPERLMKDMVRMGIACEERG